MDKANISSQTTTPAVCRDYKGNIFGNIYAPWQAVLAYLIWLGNPKGLENFKVRLLRNGVAEQEIDNAIAEYRASLEK